MSPCADSTLFINIVCIISFMYKREVILNASLTQFRNTLVTGTHQEAVFDSCHVSSSLYVQQQNFLGQHGNSTTFKPLSPQIPHVFADPNLSISRQAMDFTKSQCCEIFK